MMKLRSAIPRDIAKITALHISSWQENYQGILCGSYLEHDIYQDQKRLWQQRFAHPGPKRHIWVALDNKRLCGFICFVLDNHPKWGTLIENLHISRYYQGQGVGKQLLGTAAELTYSQFPDKGMYLEVLEENLAAQRFYQRLGAANSHEQAWLAPDGNQVREFVFRWKSLLPLIPNKIPHHL